ncbi:MAG: hypothetical protein ACR2GG_10690 [Gemmatimonadaceae bacterium]
MTLTAATTAEAIDNCGDLMEIRVNGEVRWRLHWGDDCTITTTLSDRVVYVYASGLVVGNDAACAASHALVD